MTQVAGRAGRHQLPGEVFIQTYTPEHYSIVAAGHHDYEAFARTEMKHRYMLGYPPYTRLILVTLTHEQLPMAMKAGESLATRLQELVKQYAERTHGMEVLGPVASPIPRIKDRYRFQCMVKYRGDSFVSSLSGRR